MGQLTGLDQALANLRAVGEALHSDAAQEVFQGVGDPIASTAQAIAPKRTGRLAAGIHAQAYMRDGVPAVIVACDDVPYAADVEFGTHKDRAQPFLRPAADEAKASIEGQVGAGLGAVVEGAIK